MEINTSDFNLPPNFIMPGAHKALANSEGVSTFDYGKQGYVAWRFAFAARPWKADKVKKYRLDGSDTVPVILFYRDKDNQVPIKLKRVMRYEERRNRFGEPFDKAIPVELSEADKKAGKTNLDLWELPHGFDSEMFQVAFERWKQEGAKPGTPISSWRADPGQASTLAALGIFTVDSFGQMSEEQFKGIIKGLPVSAQGPLLELHDMAIGFVNAYVGRVDAEQFGNKIEVLETSNEKLKEELENKDAEIQALLAKIQGKKALNKKAKKEEEYEVVDGEIQEVIL